MTQQYAGSATSRGKLLNPSRNEQEGKETFDLDGSRFSFTECSQGMMSKQKRGAQTYESEQGSSELDSAQRHRADVQVPVLIVHLNTIAFVEDAWKIAVTRCKHRSLMEKHSS
jgi:hypothetical protein